MTTIDDGEACKPMNRDPYITRAPTTLPTTEMVFDTLLRICIQCVVDICFYTISRTKLI